MVKVLQSHSDDIHAFMFPSSCCLAMVTPSLHSGAAQMKWRRHRVVASVRFFEDCDALNIHPPFFHDDHSYSDCNCSLSAVSTLRVPPRPTLHSPTLSVMCGQIGKTCLGRQPSQNGCCQGLSYDIRCCSLISVSV